MPTVHERASAAVSRMQESNPDIEATVTEPLGGGVEVKLAQRDPHLYGYIWLPPDVFLMPEEDADRMMRQELAAVVEALRIHVPSEVIFADAKVVEVTETYISVKVPPAASDGARIGQLATLEGRRWSIAMVNQDTGEIQLNAL
jgi:hypothetical protein